MERYLILKGDKTTAGGTVLDGDPDATSNGTPMSYHGARIYCPACNSVGHAINVPPYFETTLMGKQVLLNDDLCLCKCSPPPKLIASQYDMSMLFDESHGDFSIGEVSNEWLSAAVAGLESAVASAHGVVRNGYASDDDARMEAMAYGDPRFWTAQVGPPAPGTDASPTSAAQTLSPDDISVFYGPDVDRSGVTDSAELVLREICARANIPAVTVSSGARTAESQVDAMYKNARDNLARERSLYGPAGQQVLDAYEQAVAAGRSEQEIKAAMLDRINAVGPGNVSNHISQGPGVSTLDVAPSSLQSKDAIDRFEREVRAEPRVIRYFAPPRDKGFHLEIRN